MFTGYKYIVIVFVLYEIYRDKYRLHMLIGI